MLKASALAIAVATVLSASAASAQVIDLGGGGPRIDLRSKRDRQADRIRREEFRRDRDGYGRGYDRRDLSTGSIRSYDRGGDYGRGGYGRDGY